MLCDEKICTGCGACEAVCPDKAISMNSDIQGFIHPQIDLQACTGCGLCKDVCAGVSDQSVSDQTYGAREKYYAAKADDELLRMKSSSGGIYGVLAGYVLAQKGAVYGAALDDSDGHLACRHIRITRLEDLSRLHGSKYIQSSMSGIYSQIAGDLACGRKVLFSGTPCQAEGVRRFVKAKKLPQETLYLCDLVCHGVPSPKLWDSYICLLESEHGGKVDEISFRDKREGWHERIRACVCVNGAVYEDSRFLDMFLNNYGMRPSCSLCRFTLPERNSDITLGDFWGIERTSCADLDDDRGTSLVIVHSEKGYDLLKKIKNNITIKNCSRDEAVREQKTLTEPFSMPEDAAGFWREYYHNGFAEAYNRYVAKDVDSHFGRKKIPYTDYWVMMPDGSGSTGDEAILRGVLHVLPPGFITILNPDHNRPYAGKFPDLYGRYREIYLSLSDMEDLFSRNQKLILAGADVIDGSSRIEDSLFRLKLAECALLAGVHVHVFCSFRSNVHTDILNKITQVCSQDGQKLCGNIYWHLRDVISLRNFKLQTRIHADFFPDFAFYCRPQKTNYSRAVIRRILEQKQKQNTLAGLNFSQHSFDSFYAENTPENWSRYIKSVVSCIQNKAPDTYFVLISHDVREWEGHLSDVEFCRIAAGYIGEKRCLILHENTSYPEELHILKHLDFVVSGRMHLAVAAFSSGTIPIVYTGASKKLYTMSEKVKGMFQSRIGRSDLAASNLQELETAVQLAVQQKQQLLQYLRMNMAVNIVREKELLNELNLV